MPTSCKENEVFYFNFETGESVPASFSGIVVVNIYGAIVQSHSHPCCCHRVPCIPTKLQVWDHPCDEYHRMLYKKERAKKPATQYLVSNEKVQVQETQKSQSAPACRCSGVQLLHLNSAQLCPNPPPTFVFSMVGCGNAACICFATECLSQADK